MQVTNLAYFYESSRKLRGGKWVWVKDSNGENRRNVLLGGTILNPKKGFDHLYAGQLVQYTPAQGCLIFRSFKVQAATTAATDTDIYVEGDGYSDAPEVGMIVMKAPDSLVVETLEADTTTGDVTKTVADYTGQSAKITAVVFDETNKKFKITLDNALGALTTDDILVEATGTAKAADAKVLVPNPNTFIEADRDLMPTDGYGIENANYSISTVYDKQAWIARMQPLPKYVLAKNRSYIDGIFWI
jgi:hypothetical protein